MHYYFYNKLQAAFHFRIFTQNIIFFILTALVIAPLCVQLIDDFSPTLAEIVAYPCYFWMGFILLFTLVAALLDSWNLLIKFLFSISKAQPRKILFSTLTLFLIASLGAIVISVHGFFAGRDIRVETVNITTRKLPVSFPHVRIVQLSDVHVGVMTTRRQLQHIIDLVNQAHPDLIVSTGDLIDSYPPNFNEFARMLATLQPHYGKYAVTGNHEFYLGIPLATKFHQLADFTLLRQKTATVAHVLTVVGVDDPTVLQFHLLAQIPEFDLLRQVTPQHFLVLLKHVPRVNLKSAQVFDLQLSGHVHHGQIFPFEWLVRFLFQYDSGKLYDLGRSYLYVSRGAGMWGPPIRFLAPPEITVINLYSVRARLKIKSYSKQAKNKHPT